jgi:hypothetical protein
MLIEVMDFEFVRASDREVRISDNLCFRSCKNVSGAVFTIADKPVLPIARNKLYVYAYLSKKLGTRIEIHLHCKNACDRTGANGGVEGVRNGVGDAR